MEIGRYRSNLMGQKYKLSHRKYARILFSPARMNNDRIQQLIRFVQEEPGDPFNVYALAMEFINGQPQQARPYFDQLLTRRPEKLDIPCELRRLLLPKLELERVQDARVDDVGR